MDKDTRNALQRATQSARRRLEKEFGEQLEGIYDILPDGNILSEPGSHLDERQRLARGKIISAIGHKRADGMSPQEAVAEAVREAAFTTLNRFAALKMLEARKLIQPCISAGDQSSGFKEFTGLAPGLAALPDKGYRLYLECLFDEIGCEVKVLFNRRDVASLLWPRRQALFDLIETLSDVALVSVWEADETIGWIYQYFNGEDERRAMREASQAPRNSRELAVRNQFFTPRYVVEFLTDNTLGRIWYEMMQGKTKIVDHCAYLVRRPKEIFLNAGENPPTQDHPVEVSQSELLKLPVYISFRKRKDPRDIRLLDPAGGSGHFLLYGFDLFLIIYEEAWHDEEARASEITGQSLRADFPAIEGLRLAIPGLILRHNLHSIDIDPRATQIASLALWMRAQRAFSDYDIPHDTRPTILKTNLVVAEPMPGEQELLKEFIEDLNSKHPKVLGDLVQVVFEKMKLAGEAGSLLKIDEEIHDAIAEAKEIWQREYMRAVDKRGREMLFSEREMGRSLPSQPGLFDISDTDEQFWDKAENLLIEALRDYAKHAANGKNYQRRLFAEDAEQGFAFIDLCRKRYDVVLMNPPFGESSCPGKNYIDGRYVLSSGDIFQAFVEAMLYLTHKGGRVGVLSARTGFFLGNSEIWRRDVVFQNRLACFVDLGLGVLDAALVEVASYVIEHGEPDSRQIFVNRQLSTRDKEPGLIDSIRTLETGLNADTFLVDQGIISKVPACVFAYWAPARLLRRYSSQSLFGGAIAAVRQGIATADDFRFARLGWEVRSESLGRKKRWIRFSKGGEYSPFFDDIHLLVNWADDGKQLKAFPGCYVRNEGFYFLPGATYTVRTASAFAAKVLPADCIFSHNAQSWFVDSNERSLLSIAFLSCRVPQAFLELAVGAGDIATAGSAARRYTTAVVESVPAEPIERLDTAHNRELAHLLLSNRIGEFARLESSCLFGQLATYVRGTGLVESALQAKSEILDEVLSALEWSKKLDDAVTTAFSLIGEEASFIETEVGPHPWSYIKEAEKSELHCLLNCSVEELMKHAVENQGSKRWFTKKSYFVDRHIEILSHILEASPKDIVDAAKKQITVPDLRGFAESVFSECVGMLMGRWDIRIALDLKLKPKLPDPFDTLPVCPPAMLVSPDGFPAESGKIVSEEWLRARPDANTLPEEGTVKRTTISDSGYPVDIRWNGMLIDDPGHPDDIITLIRQTFDVIWQDKAHEIYAEAIKILDPGRDDLRPWFRVNFFTDHIKRYSKSRRKAPIYWCLSTPSRSYAVWLYYHRFSKDTFYKVLDCVKLKLQLEERKLATLRVEIGDSPTSAQRRQLADPEKFVAELKTFHEEVALTAPLWKPDLNDGVIINFAPLWRLAPQPSSWQKECKQTWDALIRGDYDWAHLAMHLWPERVVPKCHKDRSLAIAHGLEKSLWEQDEDGKWKPRDISRAELNDLIAARSSRSVKDALEKLLSMPATAGNGGRRRRG